MTQPPKDRQADTLPPRRNWAGVVAKDVSLAAKSAFIRAGFSDPTLILHWKEIAGPDTAQIARPLKFVEGPLGGTLTLKTEPAAALFLQHDGPALCQRINAYLGRPAVSRLRFVQGPIRPLSAPPIRPVAPREPSLDDPVRRFRGPEKLGAALLTLAAHRRGRASTD